MSDVKSHFKGFNPSSHSRDKILNLIDSLKYLLPPESDIKVSLSKYSKGFEGTIVVRSELGDFLATCKNDDIMNLVKDLRSTLKQQVHKFKDHRHTQRKVA